MTIQVLGLDIGGANLKAAHSNGAARTVAFALWQHPERLSAELQRLGAAMPVYDRLAITLTGELCDCFPTKREGVRAILQSVRTMAGAVPISVWCTTGRFLDIDDALRDPQRPAAANWLALAHWVARRFADERVLLIDIGSTTTDIVYLNHGRAEPRGLTDQDRLASGELVYTGVRRTPICAVLLDVAAEFFATTLDAYLLLGLIPETPDDCGTADGRPATRAFAYARMAHMRCADVETFGIEEALALADLVIKEQRRAVQAAMERVITGRQMVERIVVSGSGEFLARSSASQPGWSDLPISSLSELLDPGLSEAACAYAVAMLAQSEAEEA
jgi:probable H4MPT-linked C1 transfer pathway protein